MTNIVVTYQNLQPLNELQGMKSKLSQHDFNKYNFQITLFVT